MDKDVHELKVNKMNYKTRKLTEAEKLNVKRLEMKRLARQARIMEMAYGQDSEMALKSWDTYFSQYAN